MGEWVRKSQGKQQVVKWGPKYGGAPTPSPAGSWRPRIPLWEKLFCTSECSISWEKLCETKKVMYMYDKIVQWNDSAGEEAFRNAKSRYWAKINDLQCNIPLPGPDIYIDVVDQEPIIDPKLIEDLSEEPTVSDDEGRDVGSPWEVPVLGLGVDGIAPTGWEDPVPTSGVDASNSFDKVAYGGNHIDSYQASNCLHNGISGENENVVTEEGDWDGGRDNSGGNWVNRNRNKKSGIRHVGKSRFAPRHMNPSYQGGNHQGYKNWKNWGERDWANPTYKQSVHDEWPQLGSMHACGPMDRNQGPSESGAACQWQKSVS